MSRGDHVDPYHVIPYHSMSFHTVDGRNMEKSFTTLDRWNHLWTGEGFLPSTVPIDYWSSVLCPKLKLLTMVDLRFANHPLSLGRLQLGHGVTMMGVFFCCPCCAAWSVESESALISTPNGQHGFSVFPFLKVGPKYIMIDKYHWLIIYIYIFIPIYIYVNIYIHICDTYV